MHISCTEFKEGTGYWRIMADLNPSIIFDEDAQEFDTALRKISHSSYEMAAENGAKYFDIPTLNRKRGVCHFYLEGFSTADSKADRKFAISFGEKIIECYGRLFKKRMPLEVSDSDLEKQLDYHTLYFYQVTTLDRGTIAGLLVHNENDVGILGSLPRKINRDLLCKWVTLMPAPTDKLLNAMIAAMPDEKIINLDEELRTKIAQVIRQFYKDTPEAMKFLARGNVLPKSNKNHSSNPAKA